MGRLIAGIRRPEPLRHHKESVMLQDGSKATSGLRDCLHSVF